MSQTQFEQRTSDPSGDELVQITETRHWFSPGRVIGIVLGIGLGFIGIVALLKTGIAANMTSPQTTVFGMPQSAAVGLGELTAGLLLVLCGAWEESRPYMALLGFLGVIAGVAGAVASPEIQHNIGFASNTAWFIALCGVIAIVAAVLPAVFESRRDVREVAHTNRTRIA
jgi:hypothetical protein